MPAACASCACWYATSSAFIERRCVVHLAGIRNRAQVRRCHLLHYLAARRHLLKVCRLCRRSRRLPPCNHHARKQRLIQRQLSLRQIVFRDQRKPGRNSIRKQGTKLSQRLLGPKSLRGKVVLKNAGAPRSGRLWVRTPAAPGSFRPERASLRSRLLSAQDCSQARAGSHRPATASAARRSPHAPSHCHRKDSLSNWDSGREPGPARMPCDASPIAAVHTKPATQKTGKLSSFFHIHYFLR